MALTKAVIVNIDGGGQTIPVMFNPPSYSLSRSNQFKESRVPGKSSVLMEYVSGIADSLSTEFFFDTSDAGTDVRERTNAIESLMQLAPRSKAPPQLLLIWGSLVFKCVIVSVRAEFDYFNTAGMPLRAKLQVEFKGISVAGQDARDRAVTTIHKVPPGQSLPAIAGRHYQDPAKWREIAIANQIDNPRKVLAGKLLNLTGLK
ncbi:hypothetical protein ACO0LC_14590 [Undibacterium sp. JH2W]|uniref:CIS tube protein n=1 Tax=Undibacterium sp. JH2W TaxID=3413037 RepID=UPI003BF23D3E